MFSSIDFEKCWFIYQSEGLLNKMSTDEFCLINLTSAIRLERITALPLPSRSPVSIPLHVMRSVRTTTNNNVIFVYDDGSHGRKVLRDISHFNTIIEGRRDYANLLPMTIGIIPYINNQ